MFRTPVMSIRVPDVDDTDIPGALLDMMTDVEYIIDRQSARIAEIRRRNGALLTDSSAVVLPTGANTTIQWGAVTFDTDGYTNIIAAPANIVLPDGIWWIYFNAIIIGAGALADACAQLNGSVSGALCYSISPTTQTSTNVSISTLVKGGETFTASVYQNSGGNGSLIGDFGATKIATI